MYKLIYAAGQWLRKRHYKLFRRIVENPIFSSLVRSLYGEKLIAVRTPEGDSLAINPIYHGNFLTQDSILAYEPEMRQLFQSTVRGNMVVYDVGANVGVFSLYFLNLVGSQGFVYSFEPEPNNFRCLSKTQSDAGKDNFSVHAVGVGKKSETLYFDRRGGAMSGRLVSEANSDSENVTEMQVVSIDEFVYKEGNRAPDFVKIDVEGNEIDVIDGMRRTLEEHGPVIVCELHHALEPKVVDIQGVLDSLGYKSYDVNNWLLVQERAPLESYRNVHHIVAFPATAPDQDLSRAP